MVIKELTMNDGKKYIIGFKEIVTGTGGMLECHILKKQFWGNKSLYKKECLKPLNPDYERIALFTALDYERELEEKENLINAIW